MQSGTAQNTLNWNRSHYLDRMTFSELVTAYFQHYAVRTYLGIALLAGAVAVLVAVKPLAAIVAIVVTLIAYPVVWYVLHRWVLHGRWMWRHRFMAKTWKRIHFDHHQDPNNLEILFGAVRTTLPTVFAFVVPVGWLVGGLGGIAAATATATLTTCIYEFVHCVQHLGHKPRQRWLAALKAKHLAHHFHDETGNFGIVDFGLDRLFGTFYDRPASRPRSPTVFNLGYDEAAAQAYPWVRDLSGEISTGPLRHRAGYRRP